MISALESQWDRNWQSNLDGLKSELLTIRFVGLHHLSLALAPPIKTKQKQAHSNQSIKLKQLRIFTPSNLGVNSNNNWSNRSLIDSSDFLKRLITRLDHFNGSSIYFSFISWKQLNRLSQKGWGPIYRLPYTKVPLPPPKLVL